MTPPTHPETEKLIAEFRKLFGFRKPSKKLRDENWNPIYKRQNGFHVMGDGKEMTQWLRTALTTSFASGRAQGAKEERERIQFQFHLNGTYDYRERTWTIPIKIFKRELDALKGET